MSSDEVLVKVEGVAKKYCKDLKRSLRYGLQELMSEFFLQQHPTTMLRRHEFWALQDVNFELTRGEAFGIIGVNGSGKTTLLKIMQGLLKPTKGQVTMKGHVGALISLGAGFQPLLTGRENIYVNASILRVPKRQVDKRLNEILAFAELGDFIDAPIKTYSSGMRGRLGFAIATHLIDPDVLLLDEVLATGDWKFKDKCFRRMEEIVSSGATVIFVSHLVPKVEKFCNRAMLLHKGVVKGIGPATEICQMYYDLPEIEVPPNPRVRRKKLAKMLKQRDASSTDTPPVELNGTPITAIDGDSSLEPEILAIELLNHQGNIQDEFHTLDTLITRIHCSLFPYPEKIHVTVQLLTPGDELSVSYFSTEFSTEEFAHRSDENGSQSLAPSDQVQSRSEAPIKMECTIPELLLREGKYRVSVTITPLDETERQRSRSRFTSTVTLLVKDLRVDPIEGDNSMVASPKKSPGLVYMPSNWSINTPIPLEAQ